MFLSMVPTLSSVFLMQRLFIICDLDSYSDMKKMFRDNTFQTEKGHISIDFGDIL